jgi:uncharacterized protein YkwD
MRRLHLSIVGVTVILATTSLLGTAAPSALASTRDSARHQVLKATNHSRSSHHLARLSLNARMSELARRHSAKMASRKRLFHTADPSTYLKGVRWHAWGENVGYTHGSVSNLQKAFMHSPVHRDNILNGAFKHVAIGAVQRGGTLWVTVFFYG